jgi:hypothetical protein
VSDEEEQLPGNVHKKPSKRGVQTRRQQQQKKKQEKMKRQSSNK